MKFVMSCIGKHMKHIKLRLCRNALLVSVAALMPFGAMASEPAKLEIKIAAECKIRTFTATASGSEKLDAGGGKLALLGLWKPANFTVKAQRRVNSAYVYDYSKQNSFGGYSSKGEVATPQLDLFEATVELDIPKETRAVDISGIELQVTGSPSGGILGFDILRSAEISDDFVNLDNGLCIMEGDSTSAVKYMAILNASAPRSTIVFLASGATRPLPVRILFAVPTSAKSVIFSRKTK
jgi:hypothetical protein